GVVVTGSVVKSGDSLRISATVVDARDNKPIRVIEPVAGPASDPLIAISALRERLLGSLASGEATRRVSLAGVPPRYEAYRAMVDGWDLVLLQKDREALPLLRRALQLDSNFALVHVALGLVYIHLGLRDSAEHMIADVDRMRDRLSVTDKLQVDAFRAMLSGDTEAELRSVRQYIARDSDPAWMFEAGNAAHRLLRPNDAIGLLRASDSAMIAGGWKPQISVLSSAYHEAGDFVAQLSTLERGRKLFPAFRAYAGLELSALAGLRRPGAALALADTLIAGTSGVDPSPVAFVVSGADEFLAHGDVATANLLARKVTTWDAAHPGPPPRARHITVGAAWLILRQLDSAATHYRAAAHDSLSIQVAGYLAVISAQQGDTSGARATADSLAALPSPRTAGARDYWRAAILGQLGEREQAVSLLRQSTHEGQSMESWHADAVLRALHGYPPFDQMITAKQ
ncbi:MAG: tetratricopeptide repeat protein, partial [Gemmatimonadaceae bacterium]